MIESIPFGQLFPACASILDDELRPIHYKTLAELGARKIHEVEALNMSKIGEDVREKLLGDRQYGCAYIGRPHCVGVKLEWFTRDNLFPSKPVFIPANVRVAIEAGSEAVRRSPYMIDKYPRAKVPHSERIVKGLVIEKHVSGWFRTKWPATFKEADNANDPTRPCDHDFKLSINGRDIKFDVAGKNSNGTFGAVDRKPKADYHLLAEASDCGRGCYLYSFVRGDEFKEMVLPWAQQDATKFCVFLNCLACGMDYNALKSMLFTETKEAA